MPPFAAARDQALDRVAADAVERVRSAHAAYRRVPDDDFRAAVRAALAAALEAAAGGGDEAVAAIAQERTRTRAAQRFAPDDVLAVIDCSQEALADALEEPAGRAALGDPSWPDVLAAFDRARDAVLAGLALFDDTDAGARVRRLVQERRVGVLLAQLLRARAEERAGLARKLHDGPLQSLTAAVLRLDGLRTRLAERDDPEAGEAAEILSTLRAGVDDTRALMFSQAPDVAGDGLARALAIVLDRFAGDFGVDARLVDALDERPPPDVELLAFAAVEEALANVAAHARASRVVVRLGRVGGSLEVAVEDDGRGFDPGEATLRGLAPVRTRFEAAGGTLRVESAPGRGTTALLRLPVWT